MRGGDRVEVSLELIQELGVSMLCHDRLVDSVEVRDLLEDAPGHLPVLMLNHFAAGGADVLPLFLHGPPLLDPSRSEPWR